MSTTDPTTERTGSFKVSEIAEIPRNPGVYMFFDKRGKVIYIGKAVNLRARVRQYFADSSSDDRPSIPWIREHTHHIETILTPTEREAFLLENTLIKRHKPRFNVRLRDDKTYVSVRIDASEEWPRAQVMRPRTEGKRDKALYFGPYTNAHAIRETVSQLQRIFPLRSCSNGVLRNRSRPCILHQIGRCCAPCVGLVEREEYDRHVRNTILFLRGHTREVLDNLRAQMREHSEKMEFEQAAVLRDRIATLTEAVERQRVASHEAKDRDVVGLVEEQGQSAIALLMFRNGSLVESQNWVLEDYGQSAAETLSNFLGQYYATDRLIPHEVLLPTDPGDREVIEGWLTEKRQGKVGLIVPQRGEKKKLIAMAADNAREVLTRKISGRDRIDALLRDLARRLKLDEPPRRIECYDIATLQGTLSAGAQVTFLDGEPDKASYRLYRIKGVEGQDDFAMMREVLSRRFRPGSETASEPPGLIVVDGGKGQLSAAVRALEDIGQEDQPIAALAKSRIVKDSGEGSEGVERSPERLFVPGRKNPVVFPPHAPSFYLLQRLRDEAHRFVNTYHVNLRRKSHLKSGLEDIPGVGKKRARVLLRHFGSLERVRGASVEELAQAPGIPEALADTIAAHFHELDEA